MRYLLVFAIACGGASSTASLQVSTSASTSTRPATSNGCPTAYAEYEKRWRTARGDELREVGFDDASTAEVLAIEVALLPKKADMAKLRSQYTVVAVFLPDSPWPLALDAADAAIEQCGEEAPHP